MLALLADIFFGRIHLGSCWSKTWYFSMKTIQKLQCIGMNVQSLAYWVVPACENWNQIFRDLCGCTMPPNSKMYLRICENLYLVGEFPDLFPFNSFQLSRRGKNMELWNGILMPRKRLELNLKKAIALHNRMWCKSPPLRPTKWC